MRRLLIMLLVASSLGFVGRGGVPCDQVRAQPQCLVALLPGPLANTLDIVKMDVDVSTSAGELLLTTVSVDPSLSFSEWVRGSFDRTVAHVDRDLIYPPGVSVQDVREANVELMQQSQLNAIFAGLLSLGYDLSDVFDGAEIMDVADFSSAADGRLKVGDVIVEVAGTSISRGTDLQGVLARFGANDDVPVVVERQLRRVDTVVQLVLAEGSERPLLGVSVQDHLALPIDITIDAGEIGGPSAGTMFALAIIDLLTPEDLTGGRIIAGTGEIQPDGTVNPIGGIQQKVLGATQRRDIEGNPATAATVFLVPDRNFEEAKGAVVRSEIMLVPIATLQEAVAALQALRDGQLPVGAITRTP
ncbi:MAG: PDZ domain-containing protein [Glaciecola sp.]